MTQVYNMFIKSAEMILWVQHSHVGGWVWLVKWGLEGIFINEDVLSWTRPLWHLHVTRWPPVMPEFADPIKKKKKEKKTSEWAYSAGISRSQLGPDQGSPLWIATNGTWNCRGVFAQSSSSSVINGCASLLSPPFATLFFAFFVVVAQGQCMLHHSNSVHFL